ncbi:MAG TPA: DedA family protein [Actinoplanes sp.]|jgi:membrane protein DedA with SNARE-associated domain
MFVTQFGYLGVALTVFVEGFGVPAPGETAILAGAGAAGQGKLNIVLVAVVAFAAAVGGDSVGYLIGRVGGRRLVLRYGRVLRLTPERFGKVEAFMGRHGPKVVVAARFVEGLRQLNGLVAGATRMPWRRFVLFNAIGAAAWVAVWSVAGYLAGDHWDAISAVVSRYEPYAIGAVVLIALAIVVRIRTRRKAGR